jgi:ABC-2 type transport system ATP-binding protein
MAAEPPSVQDGTVVAVLRRRKGAVAEAVRRLDAAGAGVDDLSLRRPTLDDVFLVLTGRSAEEAEDGEGEGGREEER